MGACADFWQAAVDQIVEDFSTEKLTHEEARRALIFKGLKLFEAEAMLDEAVK